MAPSMRRSRSAARSAKPEFTGNVDATKLQADLGDLGIELRDGRVRGEARATGGFKLAASVASGKGHIEFDGTMDERGVVDAEDRRPATSWPRTFPPPT